MPAVRTYTERSKARQHKQAQAALWHQRLTTAANVFAITAMGLSALLLALMAGIALNH